MNARELAAHFGRTFGFSNWPKTFEVDAETYGNVCQAILDNALEIQFPSTDTEHFGLNIAVGEHNGLMFKNVELILKGQNNAGKAKDS